MTPFPAIGRIKHTSKQAAAKPIRFPEWLAIRAQIIMATIIAKNRSPNASLKRASPTLPYAEYLCRPPYYTIHRGKVARGPAFSHSGGKNYGKTVFKAFLPPSI
jgi:hypothetical protein